MLGNIRELEKAIESACALATGVLIDVDDLPDEGRGSPVLAALSLGVRSIRDVEREYIFAALPREAVGGFVRRTRHHAVIHPT